MSGTLPLMVLLHEVVGQALAVHDLLGLQLFPGPGHLQPWRGQTFKAGREGVAHLLQGWPALGNSADRWPEGCG